MASKLSQILRAVFMAAILAVSVAAQNQAGDTARPDGGKAALIGDWRGDSICVVRESACHDEDSLYHITQVPEKAGRFSLKADKIVGGKPVTMGTSECSYDAKEHILECTIPTGSSLRFTVGGNTLRGTMTLADKTLWRKITLKKLGM
jgi:hypothetical protein